MSRLFIDSFRSSGLGKVAKHATRTRKKASKNIHSKYQKHMENVDKHSVYDKLSPTGKAAMINSEINKQKKANKKKYGYEYAKPFKLKGYSTKATKQRNRLAPAKPKAKYNKWGDRIA